MKKLVLLSTLCLLTLSCAKHRYDTSIIATPIAVKTFDPSAQVDVVKENLSPDAGKAIVVFKVDRVFRGEFSERRGGPSKSQQMKDAYGDKNFLKLATLDFDDPNQRIEKTHFSAVVNNPAEDLGIIAPPEESQPRRMKLNLKKVAGTSDSYLLILPEKKKN